MQTDNGSIADRLQGGSPEQRADVKEQFVAHLRGELDGLLRLLGGGAEQLEASKRIDPASAEAHAVEILQVARYSPAADLFVRLLDTRSTDFPSVSDEFQMHFPFFPLAVAVAAIGTPAVAALRSEIGTADPTTTRFQLSCLVLKEILGEELALLSIATAAEKEQASRFVQMRIKDWRATQCSDYLIA